jgi:tetratricopeptide (TPR) repeat protein
MDEVTIGFRIAMCNNCYLDFSIWPRFMEEAINKKNFWKKHAGLWLALVLSFIALYPTLNNEILLWDDEECITDNELIREFSAESIQEIFATKNVNSNYHPLTVTSWAIDYNISELEPATYHQHSMLLHLLNIGLVYLFVFLLLGNSMVAAIVALLFGLHPMHVESVAWLAARKDVLYSFYFLLALITYVQFVKTGVKKWWLYGVCLVCFVLSSLAKGMAITLPVLLLGIDYLLKRNDWKKALLEKVPFFVVTLAVAYVGYLIQQDGGALDNPRQGAFFENVFVAMYGSLVYIVKLFVPVELSAMHPYPQEEGIPWYFYAAAIPILILLFLAIKRWKTNRILLFGLGFFFVSASPVLQLLPFGQSVYSERYTYIPYLGLFLILAVFFQQVYQRFESKKSDQIKLLAVGGVFVIVLGTISFNRSKVWKNDDTLWTNVSEQYPKYYFAWANRALFWFKKGNNDKALKYYNKTLELEPNFFMGYNNRGMIYKSQGNLEWALMDFNRATALKDYPAAYINKGDLYLEMGNDSLPQALQAFTKGIELEKSYALAWYNRGVVYIRMKQFDLALQNFEQAQRLKFNHPMLYYLKGLILNEHKKTDLAYENFKACIRLNPDHAECHLEIGLYLLGKGSYEESIRSFNRVLELQPDNSLALRFKSQAHQELNKIEQ